MFVVSEKATEKVREFFKSRDKIQPLRIIVAGVGWKGPTLGMALDEPNENDEVFTQDEFTFIIEKKLLEQAQPVNVDYISNAMGEGFIINSNLGSDADCGGCTSC
jgi:iron-sulfur cluster assembly protein